MLEFNWMIIMAERIQDDDVIAKSIKKIGSGQKYI